MIDFLFKEIISISVDMQENEKQQTTAGDQDAMSCYCVEDFKIPIFHAHVFVHVYVCSHMCVRKPVNEKEREKI